MLLTQMCARPFIHCEYRRSGFPPAAAVTKDNHPSVALSLILPRQKIHRPLKLHFTRRRSFFVCPFIQPMFLLVPKTDRSVELVLGRAENTRHGEMSRLQETRRSEVSHVSGISLALRRAICFTGRYFRTFALPEPGAGSNISGRVVKFTNKRDSVGWIWFRVQPRREQRERRE